MLASLKSSQPPAIINTGMSAYLGIGKTLEIMYPITNNPKFEPTRNDRFLKNWETITGEFLLEKFPLYALICSEI